MKKWRRSIYIALFSILIIQVGTLLQNVSGQHDIWQGILTVAVIIDVVVIYLLVRGQGE